MRQLLSPPQPQHRYAQSWLNRWAPNASINAQSLIPVKLIFHKFHIQRTIIKKKMFGGRKITQTIQQSYIVLENASHGCGSGVGLRSSWQPWGGLVDPFQIVAAQTQPLLFMEYNMCKLARPFWSWFFSASPPHYVITSVSRQTHSSSSLGRIIEIKFCVLMWT